MSFLEPSDLKEGVGCRVWGIGKETSFVSGGENFFIGTDSWLRLMVSWDALKLGAEWEVGEWEVG